MTSDEQNAMNDEFFELMERIFSEEEYVFFEALARGEAPCD